MDYGATAAANARVQRNEMNLVTTPPKVLQRASSQNQPLLLTYLFGIGR